jgi:feruloyl-CoA synthase
VRHAVGLLTPGMVLASDAERFKGAIQAAVPSDVELIFTRGGLAGRRCTSFEDLLDTPASEDVDVAHDAIGPHTIAKFLFTRVRRSCRRP